jgi:multicomponent Na+:H+ antiporter subunit B
MSEFVVIDIILFAILAVAALAIAKMRQLFAATMLLALFSLTAASIFVLLDAVDVALTEAAVGAGMTTVLFLGTLALTRSRERTTPARRSLPAAGVAAFAGAALIYASFDLPPFADPGNPVHVHPVTERYLVQSAEEIGIPNAVTAVLASYRGFDTLGEVVVIFTAAVGVLLLFAARRRRRDDAG